MSGPRRKGGGGHDSPFDQAWLLRPSGVGAGPFRRLAGRGDAAHRRARATSFGRWKDQSGMAGVPTSPMCCLRSRSVIEAVWMAVETAR
jgi:hypothetical protein